MPTQTKTVFIDVPELSTVKLGIDGISVLDRMKKQMMRFSELKKQSLKSHLYVQN